MTTAIMIMVRVLTRQTLRQPVYTPVVDTTPSPPPPPPKYYDMFGGEHSSQAAADAADAQYEAQAVAAEAVETVTGLRQKLRYFVHW